jgi:hypothetical protein
MSWTTSRLRATAVAFPVAAALAFTGTAPARALEPAEVIGIIKGAYDAYKMLVGTHELTLPQATTRIIDAVNAAKADTLSHIDRLAAADVRACATSAVIEAEDIRSLTPDNKQAFARETTSCVTLAASYLSTVGDLGSVDELGFAVNVVGPIALLARSHANLSTTALKSALVGANNTVLSRLNPRCSTVTIPYFDARDKPVPSLATHVQTCTAYNGDRGTDSFEGPVPRSGIDYTKARAQAVRRISYPVAAAALSSLNS